LKLSVGLLEHGGRGFESLPFCFVEVKLDDRLHSPTANDAGSAEGNVTEAVLAGHQGGDDENGTLIAENGLTDAGDAGCDGEAGVAFEKR
jgi:hypothetical protein